MPVGEFSGPAGGEASPGGTFGPDANPAGSVEAERGPDDAGPEPVPTAEVADDLTLRRALADLDNLRKRSEREVARVRSIERAEVVAQWLPIVDNLERALEHSGADSAAVVEGVRAVHDQAVALLARLGFPRFDDLGKPFDPGRHEAMGVVDSELAPGTVVGVVRPGYDGPGVVLRPAGVVVSRRA